MIGSTIAALVIAGGLASGVCIIIITLVMSYEVLVRYLFSAPTYWALEVVSYLLVASVSLGAGYTLRENAHVAVDVVQRMLPTPLRALARRLVLIAIAAFAAVLLWQGVGQAHHAFVLGEISLTPLAVQMWMPSAIVPVGAALLLLQALELLVTAEPPAAQSSQSIE